MGCEAPGCEVGTHAGDWRPGSECSGGFVVFGDVGLGRGHGSGILRHTLVKRESPLRVVVVLGNSLSVSRVMVRRRKAIMKNGGRRDINTPWTGNEALGVQKSVQLQSPQKRRIGPYSS